MVIGALEIAAWIRVGGGDLLNNVCTRPIIGWPSKVPSKPIAVCKFLGSLRPFRLLDPGTRGSRIRLGSFSQNKVEHGLN